MIKDIKLTENQASVLGSQLWRYYDIDADVHRYCDYYTNDDIYRIWYEVESGVTYQFVKMRLINDTVEDLYLVIGNNIIEPTTTKEEQELR